MTIFVTIGNKNFFFHLFYCVNLFQDSIFSFIRYYRDPPEFQTVIASIDEESNFHFGYFRDDPQEVPVFVAAYGGKKNTSEYSDYKFTLYGDNLFAAIFLYIGQLINKVDPFKMTSLQKLKVCKVCKGI